MYNCKLCSTTIPDDEVHKCPAIEHHVPEYPCAGQLVLPLLHELLLVNQSILQTLLLILKAVKKK